MRVQVNFGWKKHHELWNKRQASPHVNEAQGDSVGSEKGTLRGALDLAKKLFWDRKGRPKGFRKGTLCAKHRPKGSEILDFGDFGPKMGYPFEGG